MMYCQPVVLSLSLAAFAGASLSWLSPELRQIEVEQHSLELALATLPPAPTLQLTQRIGYHSGYSSTPDTVEWVELDLRREEALDAVVLVPAASSGGGVLAPGYGFPVRYRVEVSDSADHAGRTVIADQTTADFPNPGALPVYLSCTGHRARFVRLTATRLFRDGDRALLAMGEIMLLQGKRNLAARLSRGDFNYSRTLGALPVWGLSNLVDGHLALGPPEGTKPSPSLGFASRRLNFRLEPHPALRWVQVDLGKAVPIDEVRLFPAHPPEFAHRPGYGWPLDLKVEISDDPDFNNAVALTGFQDGSINAPRDPVSPGDNPMSFVAMNETARYVRVTPQRYFNANGGLIFALSEMQVWSGDANVALGRPVTALDSNELGGWSKAALVDGFTSRHDIVDWPDWLSGLSKRREITQRLALLETRRNAVVSHLKILGTWLLASTICLALLILLVLNLRQRRERRRELEALRERISQDLHDEIGSSLGSIAFISEDALALTGDDAVRRELSEIRDTARQTLDSMRDIVRLAQRGTYGSGDLTEHLREIAERMLRGIPHTLEMTAAPSFNQLPMAQRRDLVLIFKETLHNLVRHSRATKAEITLAEEKSLLSLTVHDNGRGFDPATASAAGGMGLLNLQRRVAKHGGAVRIDSAPGRGSTLTLTLPRHG